MNQSLGRPKSPGVNSTFTSPFCVSTNSRRSAPEHEKREDPAPMAARVYDLPIMDKHSASIMPARLFGRRFQREKPGGGLTRFHERFVSIIRPSSRLHRTKFRQFCRCMFQLPTIGTVAHSPHPRARATDCQLSLHVGSKNILDPPRLHLGLRGPIAGAGISAKTITAPMIRATASAVESPNSRRGELACPEGPREPHPTLNPQLHTLNHFVPSKSPVMVTKLLLI
jgi:hypothetical protein